MTKEGMLDKSTWGPGPWQDEPDEKEWEAHGFPCFVRRHDELGHLCGYIALPKGHPWVKLERGTGPDVHGGITLSEPTAPRMEELGFAWIIGFDCGHAWDLSPGREARIRSLLWPGLYSVDELDEFLQAYMHYITFEMACAETERLALQAREAMRQLS